jgi:hypothetical protein
VCLTCSARTERLRTDRRQPCRDHLDRRGTASDARHSESEHRHTGSDGHPERVRVEPDGGSRGGSNAHPDRHADPDADRDTGPK